MKGKSKTSIGRTSLVPVERIQKSIFLIRGHKVMLDNDLAGLYGVETKVLNQAVKRNIGRFPADFMFQLTAEEKKEVVTNCDHLAKLKFSPVLPYAFTEQGVAMLSSVLRSRRAIEINIAIMRVFVRLREILADNAALRKKLEEHDAQIKYIFNLIGQMMQEPEKPKKRIGFLTELEGHHRRK
ncbi:MAG: ORF6N domain-containing protein [Sedimentisphaerales bacterium]|nr:ORF6N domain-containing protein [Sedimentisphaerales bacterium]